MERIKTTSQRLWAFAMALILAMGVALPLGALPQAAYADEAAVRDTATGVMKFNWHIDGDDYSRGSCFLINDDHVLTAYHCTMFSSAELDIFGYSGSKLQELRDRMTYSVTINRDVKVGATLVNASEEQDFAIFKLDQPINNHKALSIRDSSTVQAAETVYTVGFPANSDLKVINTYTAEDVTYKSGVVNKVEGIYQGRTNELFTVNGYFLQTDSVMSGGDSGGPTVDANGNVVGISVLGNDNYYLAVASDKVTPVLDDLGIDWTAASDTPKTGGNTGSSSSSSSSSSSASEKAPALKFTSLDSAISKAKSVDASKYTDDSYKALSDALADAEAAKSISIADDADESEYEEAQDQIDAAAQALTDAQGKLVEKPSGLPMGAIIGIIIAVVAVIAIIVIVLVMRSRKKKNEEQAPTVPLGNAQPAPAQQASLGAGSSQSWSKPGQNAIPAASNDVSETTILDDEASDTVILFQAASGGSLTRMSTNEQIPINSAEFTIGRERSKVNYCLEGNSSISRIHVRLVVRDGKTFLIDNKAANGTFVNGVKARPGQEIQLKSGDIITLADEKFKYNA